jgi:hypothetical protein
MAGLVLNKCGHDESEIVAVGVSGTAKEVRSFSRKRER